MRLKHKTLGAFLAGAALLAGVPAQADVIEVTNDSITGTVNWMASNTYLLNGFVFVEDGEVLNIEAGTVIKGKPGSGASTAALVVARGGKIFANGTADAPIIFTAEADDTTIPDDLSIYQRGLWGGVVILGRATINTAVNSAGNAASPKYEVYEGLPADNINFHFGGDNDADSSGVFRYVSIRHGGKVLESNKEINGLSLGAVGSGTVIENVECYAIADDGFEFFGGTVNTKWLISAFNDDDAFDADMGFRGKNQFWFAIQEPGARDKGGEFNGEPNTLAVGNGPVAQYTIYNGTWIGAGAGSGGNNNNAFNIRDYASPRIYNSIVTDFAQRGVAIDATAATHLASGSLDIRDNIWWGFTAGNTAENIATTPAALTLFTETDRNNSIVDPLLRSIHRDNLVLDKYLDPRPAIGSPAFSTSRTAPADGFYTPAPYKGAFGHVNWASWSYLAQIGILTPEIGSQPVIEVSNDSITGTVNWTASNTYLLNGFVFVEDGEVLNIEAGTVIKGKPGSGASTAALVVARGGKIFANGTADAPIIFTAEADDTTIPDDLSIYQRGLWGGVVILGRATINTAVNSAGNAATPKYEVYEGLPADNINFHFGGDNDADSSGVFRYVSIRHGGKVLESNKEINGLSLGAVGSGTVIENVECYAIADDGFEFFGGTVNTKWLISAFNDDDAFDTDMGFRGKNQFWFAIQEPGARDKGGEFNGEPNTLAVGNGPVGQFTIYNATWIGAGAGSGGNNNNGFNIRDYASPRIYNSIVTDFAQRGVAIDATAATHLATGSLDLRDNIWWGFTAGNTPENIATTPAALTLFTETDRNNFIVDPQLRSIVRNNTGATKLDPRPALGSPAMSSARTAPADGFYTAASYKGAFGGRNWATWSYLAKLGILTGDVGQDSPNAASLVAGRDGANLVISFPSQVGVTYTLQHTTDFTGWSNVDGAVKVGTGAAINFTEPLSGGARHFRVLAQ